jgi:hypothetical protein
LTGNFVISGLADGAQFTFYASAPGCPAKKETVTMSSPTTVAPTFALAC